MIFKKDRLGTFMYAEMLSGNSYHRSYLRTVVAMKYHAEIDKRRKFQIYQLTS